jgi:PAS domain S-box-containing protein
MLSAIAPPTLTLEEETQRAHILHRVVWAIVPIAVVFLTVVAINQPDTISRAAPAAFFVIFLGLVVLRLNQSRTRMAAILFAAGLISLMTALAITAGGGMRSPGATMYFVIVLMTGLLLGERAAAVTAVVCAILCLGLVLAERLGLLLPAIEYESTTLWWLSCLYMSIVVVLMRLPKPVVRNSIRYAQFELRERKRTEQELLEKQKLLQTMIEETPAAVAMLDTQMRYIAYSGRWLTDYRLGNRDLKGLSHYEVFPEIGKDWKAVHKRCMAGATESREEDPFPRGDGTQDVLRWVVQPWQKGNGEIGGILMLTEVITDRIRAREERQSLRDQLQQAQKMDALGTLASGIAHDFNNLLAIIATNAEAGRMEASNAEAARNYFEEITNASSRANDLVSQILAFSRKQDSERKPISLLPTVTDALALLRATLPSNVEFRTALGSSLPAVAANATQVYQILVNLGTNAGQAMPAGGVLTLSLDHVRITKGEAAACGELHEGEYARVSIQDTGIGMTRATIDRVFEPFFTTRGAEGVGLGLSVVHRLVQDHDGAITIASEVGKGSTFCVYFPVVRADALAPSPPLAHGAARGNGEHILYIDDEERLAHALKRLLGILGYRCTIYSDPQIAVNAFRTNPDQFDAVIADITMRALSGIDVAKELRAIRPRIPIALTSGRTTEETLDLASSLGFNVWLAKPATVDKLCHTLDVLLPKPFTQARDHPARDE